MARPPLALGHHGTVTTKREDGRWVARCRVRDHDGVTRRVARWGTSKAAAQRALQVELRTRHGERATVLRPHSRFRDAADVWLQKIRERRADSTLDLYTHRLNKLVLPSSGSCAWRRRDHRRVLLGDRARPPASGSPRRDPGREAARRGGEPAHGPQCRLRGPLAGRAAPGHRHEPCTQPGAHQVATRGPEGGRMTTLAEDLALLLVDQDTGTVLVDATSYTGRSPVRYCSS